MQKTIIGLFLVGLCLGSTAQAQNARSGFGLSQKVGDADLYPAVRIDYLTNDNIFSAEDGEVESSSIVVSPELLYVADNGRLSLEAEYRGKYGSSDVSVASFADHNLRFATKAEFSKRVRAGARFRFADNHQNPGGRYTRGIADEDTDAVTFNNTSLHLFGNYGADQAKGNIELGLDIESLSFTNQSALTEGDDFSNVEPYGIFTYRLSPDLRALTELRFATVNYDDNLQDRSDVTALVGLRIAVGGKIDGEIKVGSISSTYDSNEVSDQTNLAVRTQLNFAPVDYSKFSLVVNRGIDRFNDNSNGPGNAAVVSDLLQLGWTHQWSDRLFHRATLARSTLSRECPAQDSVVNSVSYGLNLRFRRWLEMGVTAYSAARETDLCGTVGEISSDYDQMGLGVHMRATL